MLIAALADWRVFVVGSLLGYLALAAIALWDHATLLALRGLAPSPVPLRADDPIGFPSAIGLGPVARAHLQTAIVGGLFVLYATAIRHRDRLRLTSRKLWGGLALIGGAASLMLPFNSGDLLAYLGFGRLIGVHGLNPYTDGYAAIDDGYTPFAWHTWRMPYGPVVLPPLTVAGLLSEIDPLVGLYFLKLVSLAVHAATGVLLLRLRRDRPSMPAEHAAFLFLFNPLVLVELVGNGHNDGLLILLVVACFRLAQSGRDAFAIVAAVLAALVKPPALLVCGALLASLFWRRRWRPLLGGLLAATGLVIGMSALLYPPGEPIFTALLQSPNDAAQRVLRDPAFASTRTLTFALLVALAAYAVWRLVVGPGRAALVPNAGLLTMGLLLALHPMVYPWYATWLVPYAALLEDRRLRIVILAYSFTIFTVYSTTSVIVPIGTELHPAARFVTNLFANAPLLVGLRAMLPASAGTDGGGSMVRA